VFYRAFVSGGAVGDSMEICGSVGGRVTVSQHVIDPDREVVGMMSFEGSGGLAMGCGLPCVITGEEQPLGEFPAPLGQCFDDLATLVRPSHSVRLVKRQPCQL
jgi:hypothetical protein